MAYYAHTHEQPWYGSHSSLIDGDSDGDGVYDHLDHYPGNPIRGIKCDTGQLGRYDCFDSPTGKFVSSSGSMYATDASAGYYVNQTNQSTQTACLAGTYQSDTGQTDCDDADAGYYVDQTGQSTQTACLAGKYNPNTGSTNISACLLAQVQGTTLMQVWDQPKLIKLHV